MKFPRYFRMAKLVAQRGDSKTIRRQYRLGAVGVRSDGVIVGASNISNKSPCKQAHSEYRLAGMLTPNSVVYVVRIDRKGEFRLAKPCQSCQSYMKNKKVKIVYYSISNFEYGTLFLK